MIDKNDQRLPLKRGHLGIYGQYTITGADNGYIGRIASKAFSQYTVDACNNFPKAIELLKESLNFMNIIPNKVYGNNYELCGKISKFLKEIE